MSADPEPTPESAARPAGSRAGGAKPAGASRPSAAARRLAEAEAARDAAQEAERSAQRRAEELAVVARRQTEMADELHAENRRLREGEIREATAPLVRGLARLADELAGLRSSAADPGGSVGPAELAHVEARVLELLHDAGVTPLRPNPGDPFDVHLHEAAGRLATEDPVEDRTIAAVRWPGLIRDDGRVLRAATVIVHRFDLDAPGGTS